ncbi:MAG: hypothetical protein B7Y26_09520 [Hydrogenophilales bacterium 16-64-46]|nr:MAG: hypothetical protein B7Z32_06425 [Hydrogenophilales bacterium 12-64-13]OYZ04863.1 MAG: hypothetical protein B7Y26_09520 [Hydrogenophilales bacterium 16-64-46]OZA37506.1 MAG: hypothetical protein B7X87_10240 [Hydrogenophilales bacterium 17-64-34]HQT00689.1 hypothetical protein [Thiobacillus sp.]
MASGQIFIAILNPGVEITPLRLRGWLQKEAAAVDARANPGDGAILRLFLTKKLRYAFTGDKLDAMLRTLTERYPAILRIETQLVETPLSADEMEAQTRLANADLQKFSQRAEEYARRKQAEAQAEVKPAPIQWHNWKSALD